MDDHVRDSSFRQLPRVPGCDLLFGLLWCRNRLEDWLRLAFENYWVEVMLLTEGDVYVRDQPARKERGDSDDGR